MNTRKSLKERNTENELGPSDPSKKNVIAINSMNETIAMIPSKHEKGSLDQTSNAFKVVMQIEYLLAKELRTNKRLYLE